jgi:hypothetical protein
MLARPPLHAAALAATLGLGACGGTAITSTDPEPVDAWLVWSSADGAPRTEWLATDGTVRGATDAIVVVRDGQLHAVVTGIVGVPTTSCEAQDAAAADAGTAPVEPTEPTGAGLATRIVVAPLAGTAPPVEVVPANVPTPGAADEPIAADHRHDAAVTAGLGRFLFVTESTYVYSCGAHGHTAVGSRVVDLETGEPIDLMAGVDLATARDTARRQLADAAVDGDLADLADPATPVELGASVPTWTDGRLAMRHLFWVETCYACSDGEWSSYSRATRVDDPTLPPALALVGVPPAVAARLSALPEPRGVSWGKAAATWAAELPAPRR